MCCWTHGIRQVHLLGSAEIMAEKFRWRTRRNCTWRLSSVGIASTLATHFHLFLRGEIVLLVTALVISFPSNKNMEVFKPWQYFRIHFSILQSNPKSWLAYKSSLDLPVLHGKDWTVCFRISVQQSPGAIQTSLQGPLRQQRTSSTRPCHPSISEIDEQNILGCTHGAQNRNSGNEGAYSPLGIDAKQWSPQFVHHAQAASWIHNKCAILVAHSHFLVLKHL